MKVMVNFPPAKSQIPKPDPIKCASYYKLLEITVTNPTEAVTLVGLKTNQKDWTHIDNGKLFNFH